MSADATSRRPGPASPPRRPRPDVPGSRPLRPDSAPRAPCLRSAASSTSRDGECACETGQVSPWTPTGVNAAPWSGAPDAPNYGAERHGRPRSPTSDPGSMPRTRVALCYGTRPQVIKASVLRRRLEAAYDVLAMDTGQHYDYELNALLYQQLGVRPPDAILEVGSAGHAEQTAGILVRAEKVLQEHRPRAVVVIGDTNSTLGCALAAAKLRIPVVHVEAGLRAHDALMAEEINRRLVDAISAVLCAPSAAAEARLRLEHVPGTVAITGDIARDVLLRNVPRVEPIGHAPHWP